MPRGDRTGPLGRGAMTGRAAGFCAGYQAPGYANPIPGRGFGMGVGRGRGFGGGGHGWRHRFYATGLPGWMRFGGYDVPPGFPAQYAKPDPQQEKQALQEQVTLLESELNSIRQRLGELEAAAGTE